MTEHSAPGWLDLLAGMLGCAPHFRKAMDEQLAREALARANIDVRRGFALLPAEDTLIPRYNSQGVGFVDADLVGPDAWGEPVTIAWADANSDGERVSPDEPLDPSKPRQLRFWWQAFPEEALRSRYAGVGGRLDTLPAELPFPVWQEAFAWPDIWLEIRTDQPPQTRGLRRLETFLEDKRSAWNSQPTGGIIHNFSKVQVLDERRFQMHVDFGSAQEAALAYWLEALAEAPLGAIITELYVRGFPE